MEKERERDRKKERVVICMCANLNKIYTNTQVYTPAYTVILSFEALFYSINLERSTDYDRKSNFRKRYTTRI